MLEDFMISDSDNMDSTLILDSDLDVWIRCQLKHMMDTWDFYTLVIIVREDK